MNRRNTILAVLLVVCLVAVMAIVLTAPAASPTGAQQTQKHYSIQITEICTKNESVIADNLGKCRDYIELYNAGEAADLTGFTLTDGKTHSEPLENLRLEKGEYRVIFLGNEVTGFGLGASGGDCIQLLDAQGSIVAQANTTALAQDEVMLLIDGSYQVSADASPGFPNDAAGVAAFREGTPDENPRLVISELLVSNKSSLPDENGAYSDAVELFNASEEALDLSRFFLSDRKESRFAYRLPAVTLLPGEYIVLFCDGENETGTSIHTNFGLSFGETLYLTDHLGFYTSLEVSHPGEDISLALVDGAYTPSAVSLGFPNTEDGIAAFQEARMNEEAPLVINEILLTSSGVPYQGVFQDVVEIINRSAEAVSTAGWFLSDGGDPYRYPLPEQTLEPGQVLVIPCGPNLTGFSLSEGETLRLTGPDFRHAPLVTCVSGGLGESICLMGSNYSFGPVTIGFANDAENQAAYFQSGLLGGLMISEVMSTNTQYLKGPYGETADWIELYNSSDSEIDLSEYALTDDSGQLGKYQLPDRVLAPGEYFVIFLTKDNKRLRTGYDKLLFSLSPDGETLYLTKGELVTDYLFLPALDVDIAYGRPAGSFLYATLAKPTPERANAEEAQITATPVAVTPQGSYDDVEYVEVTLEGEGEIYYTTNCRTPTTSSTRYTGPIQLKKTTVLRVISVAEGKTKSNVLDLTYIINENDNLPTVSVVTEPENLWSGTTGMYVWGTNGATNVLQANYFQNWEYPASVSLFETDGSVEFSEPCGLSIFGCYSRVQRKKSLACTFRAEYGASELVYPLFGEEGLESYNAFVLRTAGQDAFTARMRDVLITSLAAEYTTVPVQKYRPVIMYLNGQYYGLHYIREKVSANYIAGNYNVDPEDVILTDDTGYSIPEYRELVQYAINHDMSKKEHYDYIASQIDLDNYIDYTIAQIWISNGDKIGNVKFFKAGDEKWKWILFDTDLAFHSASGNTVNFHLGKHERGANDGIAVTFAKQLMKNADFKDRFLRRFAWQVNTIWTEENILGRIAEIEAMIEPDMEKECARWDTTYKDWQSYVNGLRRFAQNRNKYLMDYVKSFFKLSTQQMQDYGFPV